MCIGDVTRFVCRDEVKPLNTLASLIAQGVCFWAAQVVYLRRELGSAF